MKEATARLLYELQCQCFVVRFEERAKECSRVARLTHRGSRSESDKPATRKGERRRGFARSHGATTRNQVI